MTSPRNNIFEGITPPPYQLGVVLLGWSLFLISLFCPAMEFDDHAGVQSGFCCFIYSFFMIMVMPHLAFANLLMLLTTVFAAEAINRREVREIPFLLIAAFAATQMVLWDDTMGTPRIGYYLWSLSYLVTALGFFTMKPFKVW